MSTGWAGSIFDLARTRPAGVGWTEECLETDRRRQLIGSVLGSGGDRVCSGGDLVIAEAIKSSPKSVNHRWNLQIITGKCKNSQDLHQNRRNLHQNR